MKITATILLLLLASCTSEKKPKKRERTPPSSDQMAVKVQPLMAAMARQAVRPAVMKPPTEAEKKVLRLQLQAAFVKEFLRIFPWAVGYRDNTAMILVDYRTDVRTRFGKKRLVAVLVRLLVLKSGKALSPNPLNFKLKSEDGGIYTATPVVPDKLKPALGISAVDPGESVKGWVGFEVPSSVDAMKSRLRYEPTFGPKTKWIPVRMAEFKVKNEPKWKALIKKLEAATKKEAKRVGLMPEKPASPRPAAAR